MPLIILTKKLHVDGIKTHKIRKSEIISEKRIIITIIDELE